MPTKSVARKTLPNNKIYRDWETTPNVEDWSKDVESTAKALEGVDKKNLPKVKVSNEDVIALRNAKTKEQIDAALLQASQEQSISMALDNLGFLVSGIKEKYYNKDYSWLEDLANEIEKISKGTTTDVKSISEAYHKAKADGSNPELVKAVEEAIGKSKEPISEPTNKAGGVSSNSNEGNSALRDVESTAKALEGVDVKKIAKGTTYFPSHDRGLQKLTHQKGVELGVMPLWEHLESKNHRFFS